MTRKEDIQWVSDFFKRVKIAALTEIWDENNADKVNYQMIYAKNPGYEDVAQKLGM